MSEIDKVADRSVGERIAKELEGIDRSLYRGDEKFCQEMMDKICELISVGYTIKDIGNITGVASNTMYKWAWKNKAFSDSMILARRNQAHVLMDRAHEAAADGVIHEREKDANFTVNAYIKIAEKLNPRKYGVKLVEYSGEQDIRITDDQRTLRILELLAKNNPGIIEQAVEVDAISDFSDAEEYESGEEEGVADEDYAYSGRYPGSGQDRR
jgi:hypothetical protein